MKTRKNPISPSIPDHHQSAILVHCSHAQLVDVTELVANPRNPNKHSDKQVALLAKIIRHQGWRSPITVSNRSGFVVTGHGRLQAAILLGEQLVPVDRQDFASEADEWAHLVADNRIAELADADKSMIADLLKELDAAGLDMDLTGFDMDALDELLAETNPPNITEDEVPDVPVNPITKAGDLWILGEHRVLCGDSTRAEDVARLMAGAKVDLCFTSPPYGQQRDYTEEGKAKVADWDGLMLGVFGNLPMADAGQVLVNLGLIHRDGEWLPYWDGWIALMREQGWRRFGWYVWDQGPGMPGDWNGRLAPSHEFIWHFNRESVRPEKARECKHAGEKHNGKGQRGVDGVVKQRSAGNSPVQSHAIHDSVFRVSRQGAKHGADGHPAPYPVGLPTIAMQSWPGNVYDPFLGSGTTLIAAEQLGRKCYGMEISPAYCDVIVKRWENLTGKKAVLAND